MSFNLRFKTGDAIYCKALNQKDYMKWLSTLEPIVNDGTTSVTATTRQGGDNDETGESSTFTESRNTSMSYVSPSTPKGYDGADEVNMRSKIQHIDSQISVSKSSTELISRRGRGNFIGRPPSSSLTEKTASFDINKEIKQRKVQNQKQQQINESNNSILMENESNTSIGGIDSNYEIYQPRKSPSTISKQSSSQNNQSYRSANSDGRIDLADEISILDDMLGIYGDDED